MQGGNNMKKICLALSIILFTISACSSKPVVIDVNIPQTLISENVTSLIHDNKTSYNIDNKILAEVGIEFPFYISGPHFYTEFNEGVFTKIPDIIIFRAYLYTKVGVPNESIELREYIIIRNNNIFDYFPLVGYQKVKEIGGYTIYLINNDISDSLNDLDYSLDEIKEKLDDSIKFYKVSFR